MTIEDYKRTLRKPVQQHVVTFLRQGNQVLLGQRKKTFGKGKWVGIGGKVNPGETSENAAVREVLEETCVVILREVLPVGHLHFWFPHVDDESWNEDVIAYLAYTFEGDPQETDEIVPRWFPLENLPYRDMWDDARYWIPHILLGQSVSGDFLFGADLRVLEYVTHPFVTL